MPIGTQQVMATKHGYNEVTHTVTIIEDQTTTQNFDLTLLPQVTVSGRIVGSDQHTAVSYTHLRAHETVLDLVCRLLLEKKQAHDRSNPKNNNPA